MNIKYATIYFTIFFSPFVLSAPMQEGTPIDNLSASAGHGLGFEISIPPNATQLSIEIYDGSGDADLYVRSGGLPSETNFDCRPYLEGNNERCVFDLPRAATYFIRIEAYQAYSDLSLRATYDTSGDDLSSTNILQNGVPISALTANAGSETYYQIDLPDDVNDFIVNIRGSGDADLYVSSAEPPSLSDYECRPYLTGSNESCTFDSPVPGRYFIMLRAYSNYHDLTLSGVYTQAGDSNNSGYVWSGLNTYYANAIDASGSMLFDALAQAAARNHNPLTYAQVWEALKYTDEDPADTGNVVLLYTGRSQSKSDNASGNNDPEAWNREHTWPKSHGFPSSSDWAYTDIHHLRPTDASVNSIRGNKDYDNGGNVISEALGNYTDMDSFEPRDEIKGDIARMMFYMDIRYNGSDSTGTDDLTLVNETGTHGASLGNLCTLYQWHRQDPVSSEEIARHERIVERQGNRNPFVDNATWVDDLWRSHCE
jgi:serine protease